MFLSSCLYFVIDRDVKLVKIRFRENGRIFSTFFNKSLSSCQWQVEHTKETYSTASSKTWIFFFIANKYKITVLRKLNNNIFTRSTQLIILTWIIVYCGHVFIFIKIIWINVECKFHTILKMSFTNWCDKERAVFVLIDPTEKKQRKK